jgi:Zn ribbon nucleic-acid-binding protein
LNGDWVVGVPEGRVFDCFSESMISSYPPPPANYEMAVGIDHGSQPNTQIAILAAINMRDPQNPWVYVLDEYISGAAPPEAHARAVLEMLNRNGVQPAQCVWTGDNVHRGDANGTGKMSNSLLMRAFESILRMPQLPFRIRTIKKPRYSVYYGSAMIHSVMARNQFFIHPKCSRTIQSIQRWTMKQTQSERSRDEWGHAVDALRYAITPVIESTRFTTPQITNLRIY